MLPPKRIMNQFKRLVPLILITITTVGTQENNTTDDMKSKNYSKSKKLRELEKHMTSIDWNTI